MIYLSRASLTVRSAPVVGLLFAMYRDAINSAACLVGAVNDITFCLPLASFPRYARALHIPDGSFFAVGMITSLELST